MRDEARGTCSECDSCQDIPGWSGTLFSQPQDALPMPVVTISRDALPVPS
ncbi:hypothetical protein ACRRTK_024898 [Alexandromys fortis]